MLSKRYESIEIDRRTWLHVPSGTLWSTSSDTHQVVVIYKKRLFLRFMRREKGRDLTQSYNKSPYTHREIQKAT